VFPFYYKTTHKEKNSNMISSNAELYKLTQASSIFKYKVLYSSFCKHFEGLSKAFQMDKSYQIISMRAEK
jgi:hypothetical protein